MATKTPAQLARKAINVSNAEWRLYHLREKQARANHFRKLGYSGRTDDDIIARGVAGEERKADALEVSRYTNHRVYGKLITKWLGQRILAEPSHVLYLIRKFLDRPRNAAMAEAIGREWSGQSKAA